MNSRQECDSHDIGPTIKTDFLQITVTLGNQAEAVKLISDLSKKQIIACAQVQGPESSLESDSVDWRCRFKTATWLYETVCAEIDQMLGDRAYTIKDSPIVKGSDHFLNWLQNQLVSP